MKDEVTTNDIIVLEFVQTSTNYKRVRGIV